MDRNRFITSIHFLIITGRGVGGGLKGVRMRNAIDGAVFRWKMDRLFLPVNWRIMQFQPGIAY